jgi:LysW-gamma-L-lysine carboxypeptidase
LLIETNQQSEISNQKLIMNEVELLEGLLQRYSPTHQEAEAVKYLIDHMQAAGFSASIDEVGNAIGVMGSGPKEIMLLGHIDTVPGFIEVKRDGDRLFGRGAVDAKGPLACFTAATSIAGAREGYRFVVIGAVGEEGDSCGAQYVRDRYKPDMLIIGEPSGWDRITLGYKGSAWFEYEVKRTLAHTSANVESAAQAAINFWNRVTDRSAQFNTDKPKMFDRLIPSLRQMSSASDGFIESAQLKFNLRLPLSVSVAEVAALIQSETVEAEAKLIEGTPAYRAEKNTPLVRAFLSSIRKFEGTPSFSVKSGTSDMNLVAPIWGCPTLAYGPGDSDLDHTPHEHILVSEYQRSVQILAGVLDQLTLSL